MSGALDPLAQLGRRARDAGKKLGLDLHRFAAAPDLDGDAHKAQLVYIVDPERVGQSETDRADEAELDAILEATAAAERERRAIEAQKNMTELEQRLRDPKRGILDDE